MKDLYIALISAGIVFFICAWIYRYSQKKEVNIFDSEQAVKKFLIGFYCSLIILLAVDFLVDKHHEHMALGKVYEFYAFYGFFSCVMLIFIAKVLRLFIKRDERYYDDN